MKSLFACSVGLLTIGAAAAAVPTVPVETLFGTNYVRSALLSPDGQKIAFLAPSGGTYGIALLDVATRKVTNPIHLEDESVQSFFWKGSDHLVFTGEVAGNEVAQVASTDLVGKRVFSLLKPQLTKLQGSVYSGELLSRQSEDPEHIIVEGYTTDSDYSHEQNSQFMSEIPALILKVNVITGKRTLVTPASEGDPSSSLSDFGIDHAGRVRTAYRSKEDYSEFLYRDNTPDKWKVIRRFQSQAIGWEVKGFTGDDRGVYIVDHENSDLGVLCVFSPDTGRLGPPLFTPEDGEIDDLIYSPDGKRLIGLRYTNDRIRFHWFEDKYAKLQAKMERSFPDYSIGLSSISLDETKILVRTVSDRDLGAYYLLDLTKGTLGLVTPAGPKIDPSKMAHVQPVTFTARDGLVIHGYLTLPLDFQPGAPGALILHPHGGPFGIRDVWGFDPEVQLLANRGYAVLQVNYRGSGGYGSRFLHAGYREWGGKMQDDLTDGVKWTIANGYADPKRVGIFGASYGGYATLAGLVFTPELYQCGINYVGVSDLTELVRRKEAGENAGLLSFYRTTIGTDSRELYDHSPVNFVERIRVPLLNAYGENDPRVDIQQWLELKSQLEKYHKDYQFMLAKDEGHGFRHTADAVAFYSKVEAFLRANLPAGPAPRG